MSFSHSFSVSGADIDEQGHVNNVAYVRWIQDVAVAHWSSLTSEETREKFTWMLTRHEIDYKKQSFAGEEITATTWVGEPSRVTWERFTEIKRGAELVVKAKSIWCLIDRWAMKPTRITDEIRELLLETEQ